MAEITLDDFNSLVHMVYRAGMDPHDWPVFLENLSDHLSGAIISLQAHDVLASASLGVLSPRTDPHFLASYEQYFAPLNVWVPGMAAAPLGRVVQSEELYDMTELLRTEFYNDYLRGQDLVGASGIMLHRAPDRFLMLTATLRPSERDHVRVPIHKMFDLLGPHIASSFELMRHVPHRVAGEDYRTTLELSVDAVLFIDKAGRITHSNRAGTRMRKEATLLSVDRDGRMRFKDPQADAALQIALGAITRMDFPVLPGSFGVRRANGAPLRATIAPLERETTETIFDRIFEDSPVAMLVLRNRSMVAGSAVALSDYGLTPAEWELALAIAKGMSLRDYADSRVVSIHTVRAQLKSVFAKTETRRQSQLVALMLQG